MLFKRRDKQPAHHRFMGLLWPRSGLKRSSKYIWHRIARLPDTPHRIAAGLASGVAVSFTPFLGLHFLMGFLVAFITRGNLLASAIGTFIGNPWTFPVFFTLSSTVGDAILGTSGKIVLPEWSWSSLIDAPKEYFTGLIEAIYPLIIGSIPIAVTVWLVFYFIFKFVLVKYKKSATVNDVVIDDAVLNKGGTEDKSV